MYNHHRQQQYPQLTGWLPECDPGLIAKYYQDNPGAAKFDIMIMNTPDWSNLSLEIFYWLWLFAVFSSILEAMLFLH